MTTNMKICIIPIMALLVSVGTLRAGVVDHEAMYTAFLAGDMTVWGERLAEYTATDNLTNEDKIDLSNYLYGYLGFILQKEEKPVLEHWTEVLEGYLDELEAASLIPSTVHVYRSSIAAYRTKIYPIKTLSYANKSLKELKNALAINPEDPIAMGLQGNVLFYLPKMMGGDKQEAIEWYSRAINLLESTSDTLYRWNLCGLRLCLAQSYEKTGRTDLAIKVCRETLAAEPRYAYIRDTYLPALLGAEDNGPDFF